MGFACDQAYAQLAAEEANDKQLKFDRVTGDMRLLKALIAGDWDEREFLVVPPGQQVTANDDGAVLDTSTA